jgi:hypothetical protein
VHILLCQGSKLEIKGTVVHSETNKERGRQKLFAGKRLADMEKESFPKFTIEKKFTEAEPNCPCTT